MNVYCRICGTAGAACGDSHQTLPLLTGEAFFQGGTVAQQPREELNEYHYYVSGIELTAMMTPKMAARVNAKPVDEPLDAADNLENNEANRNATDAKKASLSGVTTKARTPRNKGADS